MADNEYDSLRIRRCVYGSCRRAADPDAAWGMGFCEEHMEKAESEIERQAHEPNRHKSVDWLTFKDLTAPDTCKCGREYTEENPLSSNGKQCRQCVRDTQARYRARRREERDARQREEQRLAAEQAEQRRVKQAERDAKRLAKDITTGKACANGHRWYSLIALYEFANLGCTACDTEFMRRQIKELESISA